MPAPVAKIPPIAKVADWYEANADSLVERYESIDFEKLHPELCSN